MCMTVKILEKKLSALTRELYKLQVAYYSSSPKPKSLPRYSQTALNRVADDVREEIWKEEYAKSVS